MTDGGDLEDWRDGANVLRGLVLSGQLWRLAPDRIAALILGLIETAEAAREALERRGDDDGRPAVH